MSNFSTLTYCKIINYLNPNCYLSIYNWCLLWNIPSGISCKQIAKAKLNPNLNDASKPEPIANPSGKLCIARPIETIIPVFNKVLFELFILVLLLNFFSTNKSQKIIVIIPIIIPKITFANLLISKASGIKSKHITDIINPDANDNIKLKNLLECFFITTPNIPPNCSSKCSKKQT